MKTLTDEPRPVTRHQQEVAQLARDLASQRPAPPDDPEIYTIRSGPVVTPDVEALDCDDWYMLSCVVADYIKCKGGGVEYGDYHGPSGLVIEIQPGLTLADIGVPRSTYPVSLAEGPLNPQELECHFKLWNASGRGFVEVEARQ